jgi:Fe-S oxidoreductase
MENVTKEVKLMMNPDTAFAAPAEENPVISRFGVKDVEDVSWKNYLDSLSCTQCGRCTEVCPANITGKLLSPRKVIIDLRARMKEIGPCLIKNKDLKDNKSYLRDYIKEEEIWACTTCNACAQECPINIDHPKLIVDMRRYLVMEEAAAPAELNAIFSNIENNGAPWQFSMQDRMLWAQNLEMNGKSLTVPTMAECVGQGKTPEYLWWVGSAGAIDDRYKKVSRSFAKLLSYLGIDYAVLGTEESSSGDVARRAGNEMLFQMQALMNIELFKAYGVKKIITCDPHVYNTFKNEYPDLGGDFEVIHHSQFIAEQIRSGKLKIGGDIFKDKTVTYHDPCYLGRANKEYNAPREVIEAVHCNRVEMDRSKSFALCCGAGGGQMFKEAEKGNKEVFLERTEDFVKSGADIIVTACPYCIVMMTDGIKYKNLEDNKRNIDLAEMVTEALGL